MAGQPALTILGRSYPRRSSPEETQLDQPGIVPRITPENLGHKNRETVFGVGPFRWVLVGMGILNAPSNHTIVDQLKQRTSYVRATEVMAILGVTRQKLCDWINTGQLPAIRLGKNNVVDPADLASFLQARQTGK